MKKAHITSIEVPANAPDSKDTVIALEFNAPVEIDPNAKGEYHWSNPNISPNLQISG